LDRRRAPCCRLLLVIAKHTAERIVGLKYRSPLVYGRTGLTSREGQRGGNVGLSETTTGVLIGAGATVGGSLVTGLVSCLVRGRRRRREDRRRWIGARRHADANFLEAGRNAYVAADEMLETLIRHKGFAQRFRAAERQFEAAKMGLTEPPNIAELRAERRAITTRIESLEDQLDELTHRLGEAATEIWVIASRRVHDAACTQVEVLEEVLGSSRSEWDSWTTEQVRAMRGELRKRWWEASEDLQQAVVDELRVESHRPLPHRRARADRVSRYGQAPPLAITPRPAVSKEMAAGLARSSRAEPSGRPGSSTGSGG
jgi:hypothetical protein